MDNAFKYVHDNKGIDDETTYPYVGKVSGIMIFHFDRLTIYSGSSGL